MKTENVKNDGPGHQGGPGQGQDNLITVQVRYQSDTVPVKINVNASISALLAKAIEATGNDPSQKDRFQLKLGSTVLDPHKKVNDYPISEGTLLTLCLTAGGGGALKV